MDLKAKYKIGTEIDFQSIVFRDLSTNELLSLNFEFYKLKAYTFYKVSLKPVISREDGGRKKTELEDITSSPSASSFEFSKLA